MDFNDKSILLCCTQSDAVRICRCLVQYGIDSRVIRPPRKEQMSCSWGVRIPSECSEQVCRCLRGQLIKWHWLEE